MSNSISSTNAVCAMTKALYAQTLSAEADMMEAAQSLEENTKKREALRQLSDEVRALENAVGNYYDDEGNVVGDADDLAAMQNALRNLRNEIQDLGFSVNDPIFQATIDPNADVDGAGNLIPGTGTFASINENLDTYIADIESAIDSEMESLGDKGDKFQLKLQMASNEADRAFQTLSNVSAADNATAKAIIGNIR